MPIEVRPAADRFRTTADGRDTWHSFSFGMHYDPHNIGFGALIAHNDEHLGIGAGYPDHPHADTEILTWVVEGALHHRDDAGHDGILEAGQVQLLSAGSGVVHTEFSERGEPARFVQTWVRPDEPGLPPAYASAGASGPGATCVASGGEGGLPLRIRGASCHTLVLGPQQRQTLPDAPRLHVFVVTGTVHLDSHLLQAGDAARLVHEGGRAVRAEGTAHLLVWALP